MVPFCDTICIVQLLAVCKGVEKLVQHLEAVYLPLYGELLDNDKKADSPGFVMPQLG